MIPGSNILNMALSVIGKQTLQYLKNTGLTVNDALKQVPQFAAPVPVTGSFQPVPRNRYQIMNLDFQKEYWTFFAPRSFTDLQRDIAGDRLIFNGATYQCESRTPWSAIDGWDSVLCVKILPITGGPVV